MEAEAAEAAEAVEEARKEQQILELLDPSWNQRIQQWRNYRLNKLVKNSWEILKWKPSNKEGNFEDKFYISMSL